MARPKLGETETERLQLKITAAEVEAIDDWRFANRVPSRSEAVRRLCAIALDEQRRSPERAGRLRSVAGGMKALFEHFEEAKNSNGGVIDKYIADAVEVSLLLMMSEVMHLLAVSVDAHSAGRIFIEADITEMFEKIAAERPDFERFVELQERVAGLVRAYSERLEEKNSGG